MKSSIGAMRQVVRIVQRRQNQDSTGEESPFWDLVCQRRAEKLPSPGTEVLSSQERSGRVPTVFRMRWPAVAIRPQMRLTCSGALFNIISAVDVDGRKTELLLSCEELVGEPTS